jgi:uncharacterized protein
MLQFDLSPLVGARPGERLVFTLDEGPQQLEEVGASFLRGDLRFTRIEKGILVEGEVKTEIQVPCVRCLEPFPLPATLEIEEIVGLSKSPSVSYSITDEGWFESSLLLREQALVSIPLKALCSPECKGMCPECGGNLNSEDCGCIQEPVDLRMAALASLLEKEE